MKRIIVLAVVLILMAGGTASAGYLGPAKSQADPGRISLGLGLATQDEKWDLYADKRDLEGTGFAVDVRQWQFYLQAALGLPGSAEIFTHLGLNKLEISRGLMTASEPDWNIGFIDDFSDTAPFGTLGLKIPLIKRNLLSVGVFAEGSYFFPYEDKDIARTAKMKIEESWGVNGGIVFQREFDDGFRGSVLYAGPFGHYREGDYEITYASEPSRSGTFKKDADIGGFFGYRLYATDGVVFDLELQFRNRSKVSIAGGLSFVF